MVTIGCELVLLSDQLLSDNSIPLSPQWLYSKPVDAKTTANPVGVCNIWCFDCYLHYQSPSPLHEIYWCDRVLLLFFIILVAKNLSYWKLESLKWHYCACSFIWFYNVGTAFVGNSEREVFWSLTLVILESVFFFFAICQVPLMLI